MNVSACHLYLYFWFYYCDSIVLCFVKRQKVRLFIGDMSLNKCSIILISTTTPTTATTTSTTTASVENHGVQSTGCMDIEPEPSHSVPCWGLPRKSDQFRLDPTQSYPPGRRCDRVWSVSPPCTREVLRHFPTCDQSLLVLPRMLTIHHLHPCPSQPTAVMTNYTAMPKLWLIRQPSTRSSGTFEDHPQALW